MQPCAEGFEQSFPSSTHVCRLLCYPCRTGLGSERGKDHVQLLPWAGEVAVRPLVPCTAGNERPPGQRMCGRMGGNLYTGQESSQRRSFEDSFLRDMDKAQQPGHQVINVREKGKKTLVWTLLFIPLSIQFCIAVDSLILKELEKSVHFTATHKLRNLFHKLMGCCIFYNGTGILEKYFDIFSSTPK